MFDQNLHHIWFPPSSWLRCWDHLVVPAPQKKHKLKKNFLVKDVFPLDCLRWTVLLFHSVWLINIVLQHRGSYKIKLYERPDMAGQMQEVSDDCPNVQDRFRMSDINSCNVVDGHWLLYDQPNYRGRTYYLRPGEYRRYSDWGGASPRIGSLRRITDFN